MEMEDMVGPCNGQVFYLLFFWTSIPWVVASIEGIVFLTTSQKSWNEKYNQGLSAGAEKGTLIVILAALFPVIAVVGILASIALPAYYDYTVRAQLADCHVSASNTQRAIEDYAYENQQLPSSVDQLRNYQRNQIDHTCSLAIQDGEIHLSPAPEMSIPGKIIYTPSVSNSAITWSCTQSTIAARYLPARCRF